MFKPMSEVCPLHERGSSSVQGTSHLCSQLPALFVKHNIQSIFDAGAHDAAWQMQTMAKHVKYQAGDHDPCAVDQGRIQYPELDIVLHDMTQDPFPAVDLLFVRDATIHMNNHYKRMLLKNWLSSGIPWILTTQIQDCQQNLDANQVVGEWYWNDINWHLDPWLFPNPVERLEDIHDKETRNPDIPIQRFMCLWHRDQIKELI